MNTPAKDTDVVIVGGGIGGLANAYALARAGHRVRVLERAPEFAEVGAGLQMAPNATRILREWGLLDDVIEAGVVPKRLVFKDALDGSELTHIAFDEEFLGRYGAPYVVIHRSDLLAILARACERAGVELVPDCVVDEVTTSADAALVSSSTGKHRADMALAADGLRSTLRRQFSDDEPICSGYVAYRGAVPLPELDTDTALDEHALTDVVVFMGPGCHLVQYPLRRGEMLNTVAVFASPTYQRGEQNGGAIRGGPEELGQAFAGACPEVWRGLNSLWTDRRWPMFDRLPISRWVNGRLGLTGDAAHPMLQYLAQGACQAIEDAHCLASEKAGSAGWAFALKEYEKVRTGRTARVQSSARVWGDLWHADGLARLIRNELFRDRQPGDFKHVDWLYGT